MTQSERILAHLKRGPLTSLVALKRYGCFRLGARIYNLKAAGHRISSCLVKRNGKHVAQYRLSA